MGGRAFLVEITEQVSRFHAKSVASVWQSSEHVSVNSAALMTTVGQVLKTAARQAGL